MLEYQTINSREDLESYLTFHLKKRPEYKKYEGFFEDLIKSTIAFDSASKSSDAILQTAISHGGSGELQNVINAIKQILQELQDGSQINFSTFWSYLRSYPLVPWILRLLIAAQEKNVLKKGAIINLITESNLIYDKLEEIVNTARGEVTKTAFNSIGGHFQKSESENRKLRETSEESRRNEIDSLKNYIFWYVAILIFIMLIGLAQRVWVDSITKVVFLFSIPLWVLILIQYLSVHFQTKNYFYFLWLEKDAWHRKAIGWTFSLIAEWTKWDLDATNRTEVIKELTKRLFEPVTNTGNDADFTTPIIELIKSVGSKKI
jgi:hypothetical protein